MPIYKKEEAKEGGWAQVRIALQRFEGDVAGVETGQWGGQLLDDNGNPVAPKEFLEIKLSNVKVLEVSEALTMDIGGEDFNFRENCSLNTGSFWVDKFLESADKYKILLPDGMTGKRLIFQKETLINKNPKYNSTNYVIAGIAITPVSIPAAPEKAPKEAPVTEEDPMDLALNLAIGKTESQFRSAIALHPAFVGSPLLALAKAGVITSALIKDGKLVEVQEGNKKIYKKA